MTKNTYRKIAREARKLAFECLNGTAPQFDPFDYDHCALGHLARRLASKKAIAKVAMRIEDVLDPYSLVTHSLFRDAREDGAIPRHEAVVFPLLALAEAAAARAR